MQAEEKVNLTESDSFKRAEMGAASLNSDSKTTLAKVVESSSVDASPLQSSIALTNEPCIKVTTSVSEGSVSSFFRRPEDPIPSNVVDLVVHGSSVCGKSKAGPMSPTMLVDSKKNSSETDDKKKIDAGQSIPAPEVHKSESLVKAVCHRDLAPSCVQLDTSVCPPSIKAGVVLKTGSPQYSGSPQSFLSPVTRRSSLNIANPTTTPLIEVPVSLTTSATNESKSFLFPTRFSIGSGSSLAELTGSKSAEPSNSHNYSLKSVSSVHHSDNQACSSVAMSSSSRTMLLPIRSTGMGSPIIVPESQTRSYSIPRGPPPPMPYGIGRTYSWPSNAPAISITSFRPPMPSNNGAYPQFLNSPFNCTSPKGIRQPQQLRISKWVNPIPPDPDDGQQQTGEQELATKMLQIQSKRFYIDVKQNRRGRFMKVAEIGADGRRNQVFMALSTAAEFRDHLSIFSEFYSNLGPPNPDTLPEDGKLKSETMVKDNRRYYLDLKENSRGRFLRVSQTIARGGPRCQIAIPAQGMIEFRDALQELLEEFGTDDGGYKGELPEGRHMRVENKNFYFDIGQNNRGIYMRISEVKTNFRTAITIPEKSWSRFRDIFADYVDKMKEGGVEKTSTSESNK